MVVWTNDVDVFVALQILEELIPEEFSFKKKKKQENILGSIMNSYVKIMQKIPKLNTRQNLTAHKKTNYHHIVELILGTQGFS